MNSKHLYLWKVQRFCNTVTGGVMQACQRRTNFEQRSCPMSSTSKVISDIEGEQTPHTALNTTDGPESEQQAHILSTTDKFNKTSIKSTKPKFLENRKSCLYISQANLHSSVKKSNDKFQVYADSISGLETCIVVRKNKLRIAFDMGYASRLSVSCNHVFISHGHMDHISAIPQHASKRSLYNMSKAYYYVPDHLVDAVKTVGEIFNDMSENTTPDVGQMNIIPVKPGEKIQLYGGYSVEVFPTVHRIRSQGYILYRDSSVPAENTLNLVEKIITNKTESSVPNTKVTEKDDSQTECIPLIAYTGDTTFELFQNCPHPDILNSRLLITEATYLDARDSPTKARDRGHAHLFEYIENEHLFQNVKKILLIHFSDKYKQYAEVLHLVKSKLPNSLEQKVHILNTCCKKQDHIPHLDITGICD